MPELPEVETTLRGIKTLIKKQIITGLTIHERRLRWPVPSHLTKTLAGRELVDLRRRGKYLLFIMDIGTMIMHLGMSGSLRTLQQPESRNKHDHIEIRFANETLLRFRDPRKFGCILWTTDDPQQHPLLKNLGPEPLSASFNVPYLQERARNKKLGIKLFLMDSKNVVGIGNIYATEVLFAARIHPLRSVQHITTHEWVEIIKQSKAILRRAIKKGGTTLKDFMHSEGQPGYFRINLKVYGRENQPCQSCQEPLALLRIANRSTVFCTRCQA